MTSHRGYNYILFTLTFLAVVFGAMDSVFSSAYLPEILTDLEIAPDESSKAYYGAWINFSFLAGGAVGGILLSFRADRIGRRKILVYAILFYGLSSGLGAFADGWMFFAVTRFFVGVGVGAVLVNSAVLLSETWPVRTKAVALGILAVAYPVGIVASGVITSQMAEWRTAFLIGAIPLLLVIPIIYTVKETIASFQFAESAKPVIISSYRGRLLSGILIYGTMLIGLWSAFSWLPTWVESLNDGNSNKSQEQRGMAVTLLGMGGMVGSIVSGWLANRWGSRFVQGVCFILCFLLSFLLFKMTTTFSMQVLVGSGLLGLCFGVSQGVLNEFIPSLFPPAIRSSATGLCFHTGRIFTAIAVFFVGAWAIALGGYGNAIFVFSTVYFLGLIALVLMKKTAVTKMPVTNTTD